MTSKQWMAFVFATAASLSSLLLATTANAATVSDTTIQREASEGPRGGDNERPGDRQRRGGRAQEEQVINQALAREGSSGGGRQRQRRGGEGGGWQEESHTQLILAREASEGPRGGDNERPGDRQRGRGGRG